MIHTKTTTQDLLQAEIFRERAATLTRAGERLGEALEKLHKMECEIMAGMAVRQAWEIAGTADRYAGEASGEPAAGESGDRGRLLRELNGKIRSYNQQREHVRTRYYYFIVVREALGMIHHQRLEEFYRIPPKKQCLPEE